MFGQLSPEASIALAGIGVIIFLTHVGWAYTVSTTLAKLSQQLDDFKGQMVRLESRIWELEHPKAQAGAEP